MCLEEKPTSAKLDMLYRKALYLLALNIADTQQLDEAHIADIHKQYGDHLYGEGDYDGAMQQYIQTIRYVQPSYVIRKVCSPPGLCVLTHSPTWTSSSSMLNGYTIL